MERVIGIDRQDIYAIDEEFNAIEYSTLDLALKSKDWLVIIIHRRWRLEKELEIHIESKVDFVSKYETDAKPEFSINNWNAILYDIPNSGYDLTSLKHFAIFKFCSPDGILRSNLIHHHQRLDSYLGAIKKLKEISKFNSWIEYDLSEEVSKLKIENENLLIKIKELEDKLK